MLHHVLKLLQKKVKGRSNFSFKIKNKKIKDTTRIKRDKRMRENGRNKTLLSAGAIFF